ncbi:hypothetical protein [Paraburkholderia sp. HP33-1]|uniref:hypothetical protein n=1 Tax=Paraburkholderia sp. HP33-1 TaxID=2883243 RepID=UPI001F486DF6|nr:hypothetical protein [Paraburkholderia sp. HP33-1]
MDIDQHEKFPIPSVLLPKALRESANIIYQVVRTAADITGEGDCTQSVRLVRGGGAHPDNATIQTRRCGGALNRG